MTKKIKPMTYREMTDRIKDIKDFDVVEEVKLRVIYFVQNAESADIGYLNNTNALVNLKYSHPELGDFFYSNMLTLFFRDKEGVVKPCFENFQKEVLAF